MATAELLEKQRAKARKRKTSAQHNIYTGQVEHTTGTGSLERRIVRVATDVFGQARERESDTAADRDVGAVNRGQTGKAGAAPGDDEG